MNSLLIERYIEIHDLKENTTTLKRTRASTRKSIDDNKVEFRKVEKKNDVTVAVYDLNGDKHEIKIEQKENTENILDISCKRGKKTYH